MQTIKNTDSGVISTFDDAVDVAINAGSMDLTFAGETQTVEGNFEVYELTELDETNRLKPAKLLEFKTLYFQAVYNDVTYNGNVFQADAQSQDNLNKMIGVYSGNTPLPTGFYWVAKDNTKVPFTKEDLNGLAEAMGTQGWDAFQRLQTAKSSVMQAETHTELDSIVY